MNIKVGDVATLTKTITDEDIHAFADIIGDHNSVHLDDEFAKRTRFGRRIAHGMLSGALISAVIGEHLPGRGAVYLSQTFRFVAPVYPGDTITARVKVLKIREDKNILTLETVCEKESGETVVTGEAVVLADSVQA
ncbi:MAG: MaoC family dehydratase [Pyrinomonadaceae bacterium]